MSAPAALHELRPRPSGGSSMRKTPARLGALLFAAALAAASCGSSSPSSNAGNVQSGGTAAPGGAAASGGGAGAPVTGGTFIDLQNFAPGAPAHIDPALA